MIDQGLSFDEGAAPSGYVTCSRCGSSVKQYWAVDGAVLCERCKDEVLVTHGSSEGRAGRVAKALVFGTGGSLAGAAVWYAVAKYGHIELALIAILLAWLVGKGVFIGSGKRGGPGYQVMAVALTWFGIGAAIAPFQFDGFVPGLGALFVLIVSLPVLVIVHSGSIILVIIYGIGLYEAWKLTRGVDPLVSGPHAVGTH